MKISWASNGPWYSVGYSTITRKLLPTLNKTHPSCLITNWGLHGADRVDNLWEGITFYGQGQGGFEEGLLALHAKDFGAKCFISIFDIWTWSKAHIDLHNNMMPFVPYVPVDSEDLNPAYKEILKHTFRIIPMSQHSEDCIKKYFPEKTYPHIPPGVDLNSYKPLWNTVEEKNNLKKKFGFSPDTFLILMLGDNRGQRKRWEIGMEAVSIFRKKNPHIKLGLYLHTNTRIISGNDYNLALLLEKFGLTDIHRAIDVYHYIKGVPENEMNITYNAADVFLQASYGESPGMSFIEAAATGTPSIGTNFTGMKQSVADGKSGHLVKYFLHVDQSMSGKAIPDAHDIADKLELIHSRGSTSYREGCIEHAQQFEWGKLIREKWLPTLEILEKEIDEECFQPSNEVSEELKKRGENIFTVP